MNCIIRNLNTSLQKYYVINNKKEVIIIRNLKLNIEYEFMIQCSNAKVIKINEPV